jgi:diadenylate cyclase
MQIEGRQTKRDERVSALGFTRSPSEDDPRRDARLLAALGRIAPGTELRQAIDDIIRSREGALIVVGDPTALSFLYSGGIRLDQPFTPQLLYELSKMDGAIIVNSSLTRLAYANVQLMPDPTIASNETGTRHRTAERVAKQTGALVISISQQRETVTVFIGELRYQLEGIADVLAKTNQALATLDTYRQRLEQALTRLTALEFQNAVVLDDVLVVLQRAELTTRMAEEIERDCVELGTEGRLIRLQLAELIGQVPVERLTVLRDYHASESLEESSAALEALAALPYEDLLESEVLVELLGYPRATNPLDHGVSPRGFRILSHIPRLPDGVVDRVVSRLAGLDAIVRASQRDLEMVEGVGPARAREIREGLRRLQEHNLVDRYLQL